MYDNYFSFNSNTKEFILEGQARPDTFILTNSNTSVILTFNLNNFMRIKLRANYDNLFNLII